MNFQTEGQLQFYKLVSRYPRIAALWNWEERSLNIPAYEQALSVMSRGEVTLARFFAGLWLWNDKERAVNIFDLAELYGEDREMVVRWLADPFWP